MVAGYRRAVNRRFSGVWDGSGVEKEPGSEVDGSDCRRSSLSARKEPVSGEDDDGGVSSAVFGAQDGRLRDNPCFNHLSPGDEVLRSELRPVTTCNACRPATINRERGESSEGTGTKSQEKNQEKNQENQPAAFAPQLQQKTSSGGGGKGPIFSWLFPRGTKKKQPKAAAANCEASPSFAADGSEEAASSHVSGGATNMETLRKELQQANEGREAALAEVAEMRSSLGELQQRLLSLEKYCDELRKALQQAAMQGKPEPPLPPKRAAALPPPAPAPANMAVTQDALSEGFVQMASETRASVKQFCKALVGQIDGGDERLMEKLNQLLQPHNLTTASKYSKGVLYHMEAVVNHCLHQDFENTVFQPNGAAKQLDPQHDRRAKLQSFGALRHLSWSEVLRKGTKYYSEEFSRYCDQKMGSILATLDWSRPWPEQLLQSFFVAAKCVWLLHLLAFSFAPPVGILRVEENRSFDPLYMEDVLPERQRSRAPARVKVMITPGFYVDDKVLRCRVLCRYKSSSTLVS